MLEKYYHSQGAVFLHEKRPDEAIECFQKALALNDQPHTHADLCRAYLQKNELDRALREMDRAIEMKPFLAAYYHQRSLVWEQAGDKDRASEDHLRSVTLDKNYVRIEKIASAVSALSKACAAMRADVQGLSCTLPCPAYCCHFTGEPIRHGVHVGAWKLRSVRELLREMGENEETFLARLPVTHGSHITRLIPPNYIINEGGRQFAYYPALSTKILGGELLADVPKGTDYQNLLWIDEKARACAFLKKGRCMIHDTGDEPALAACKEFLCLTALVFMTLEALELVDGVRVRKRGMGELNHLAVEAMLVLETTIDNNDGQILGPEIGRARREIDRLMSRDHTKADKE